jgi:ubiquinone/menaquinone biosynthesis C-methylase UbiE
MSHCSPVQPMQVKEAYRLWAPEYDATPNPLLSLEQRFLAPLIRSAAGFDVVDLGCGTGRWLTQLAEIGARSTTGVDASEEMLEHAAKKLNSGTSLILADCLCTPLATASCDWILASFLLSYVEDTKAFAREAARMARPGAVVLLSDVHPATSGYGWRRTFPSAQQVIEIETYSYQISDLRCAMNHAGFEHIFLLELPFGEAEKEIFVNAARPDLFERVEGLPVLFVAGYRRRGE